MQNDDMKHDMPDSADRPRLGAILISGGGGRTQPCAGDCYGNEVGHKAPRRRFAFHTFRTSALRQSSKGEKDVAKMHQVYYEVELRWGLLPNAGRQVVWEPAPRLIQVELYCSRRKHCQGANGTHGAHSVPPPHLRQRHHG